MLRGGAVKISRRSALGATAALGLAVPQAIRNAAAQQHPGHPGPGDPSDGDNRLVGTVDHRRNGFDPVAMATDFDFGDVKVDEDGRTVREWVVTAVDREIEIAPGVFYPAWTYSGRVPGPTLRCVEGERLRIVFQNGGTHPHSMHFHGIHSARMDGVPGAGLINPSEDFVYEFEAFPYGCHLYHCHALPLKRHIAKGMYGAFIIDPDSDRHPERPATTCSSAAASPSGLDP
jgi:FtsP/CotA-like multicopper oxidase with cupredoxin domain